jgi:dTDP-4-dehydrorhamnose reductase
MKKLLVTGANGLLGQAVTKKFHQDFEVYGCDLYDTAHLGERLSKYLKLDLSVRNDVLRTLGDLRPDIIINTAAYTNVDGCEKDLDVCWNINAKSLEIIEEGAKGFGPLIVQISTDYVFDGSSGPYRETDPPKPLGNYGMSKLAAEKTIRSGKLDYIIARTQILYGTGIKVRPNFVTWTIDKLKKGEKIRIVNDQIGNPTLVDDLAEAIFRLIMKEEYGIFHIAGNEICSRHAFAVQIAEIFGLEKSLIEEIKTSQLGQTARRPMNSSFNLDKLANAIDWLPGNITNSLTKLRQRLGI